MQELLNKLEAYKKEMAEFPAADEKQECGEPKQAEKKESEEQGYC